MPSTLPTDPRLAGKINVPSEMRTAEWSMTPQWIRERSFYMAAVTQAELLQEMRNLVDLADRGEAGEYELRQYWEAALKKAGYQPLPGQEGTIKDLRTLPRFNVTLRTNLSLLAGWRQKEGGLRPSVLRASPAWELVRSAKRRIPRDWHQRWMRVGGEPIEGRLIALKTDLIWAELGNVLNFRDAIGVDYPPFAWGSGMGWKPVGFREAKRLGLLDGWTPPPTKPVGSPNEAMETTPRVSDRALREALSEHLGGLAEWRGDVFVFTDPNGTRPYAAEALAELWKRRLPEAFANLPGGGQMQREAFLQWVIDSGFYWNDGSAKNRLGGMDVWDDFLRVLDRLEPSGREKEELFRALTWNTNEKFSAFLAHVERNGYAARPETPAESWTASMQSARKYLGEERYTVLLRLPDGHPEGRDIAPLVRAFQDELLRREVPQGKLAITDDEIVLPSWAGVRVKKIGKVTETPKGKTVEIILEPGR